MAKFTFRKVESTTDSEMFTKAAAQKMGGSSASPFKDEVIFEPTGEYCYLVTNEGTEDERYNLALIGKIAEVQTYLWASMLIKTDVDADLKAVVPQGFNKICMDNNLSEMTNKDAGDFLLKELKIKNSKNYKKLKVSRIAYKTYYKGELKIRSLVQFNIVD